jgi:hypothetical protein
MVLYLYVFPVILVSMMIEVISYYKIKKVFNLKTAFSSWFRLPPYNLAITDCL